jgi:UDP-N-acetylmuramoyl-tripeptide--D-alanyl-D-alanine ligase
VIDDARYKKSDRYLLAEDGLKALQHLATFHRSRFHRRVLGLTGSNGKTTTKELINAVLSKKYITHATTGNLNNHIGVPLTVLGIHPQVEVAIIEMGANKIGDIRELCEIAAPNHALITNIGKAHLEGFGGIEGVLRGKSELFDHIRKNGGTVFINSRQPRLQNMAKRFESVITFPQEGDTYEVRFIEANPFVVFQVGERRPVVTQLIGSYNFDNIAAALAIGQYFEVSLDDAEAAIAGYLPKNNRSQLIKAGSNTIILDAYNANPDSMKVAIDNLKAMKAGKKVAILGDMLELGEESAKEHASIVKAACEGDFNQVIFCGPRMKQASEACSSALYFETKDALLDYLASNQPVESTILVKASRGMGLEKVISALDEPKAS